jgi:hypothetical protein
VLATGVLVHAEEITALRASLRRQKQAHARHGDCPIGRGGNWGPDQGPGDRQGARPPAILCDCSHVADPTRLRLGRIFHTPALTHLHLVVLAARDYDGGLSCSEVGLTYDIETIARHLKAGVTRMWGHLTTSEAANASEAHYRATSAEMASDRIDKVQRKAREEKPGVRWSPDEGSIFGD